MSYQNVHLQFDDGCRQYKGREIINRETVVRVRLVGDDAAGCQMLLHEGVFRTRRTLGKTVKSIERVVADWPARAQNQTLPSPSKPLDMSAVERCDAKVSRFALIYRQACNLAQLVVTLLFEAEDWNVGIIDAPIEKVLEKGIGAGKVYWLPKPPAGDLYADPFGIFDEDGKLRVVFEHYREDLGRAELVQVAMDADGSFSSFAPLLQKPYHMSFPYLFDIDGQTHCVPETHDYGCLMAFPLVHGPEGLTAQEPKVLIDSVQVTDPVIFQHEDHWWLIGSDEEGLNLFIWYADTPVGPWQAHQANPVKTDVRSSRPAGPVFKLGNMVMRPAQDGSKTYGGAVVVNQIMTITTVSYEEREYARIVPEPNGPYPDGLHTLVPVGNKVLIDGKKVRFHPLGFWRRLLSKGN